MSVEEWIAIQEEEAKQEEIDQAWEDYRFNQAVEDLIAEGLA